MRYLVVSKKNNPLYSCERGIEKSFPPDHSASLVMPIGDPRDGFFYPTLSLMIDSYPLKRQSRLQQTNFATSCLIFEKNKE